MKFAPVIAFGALVLCVSGCAEPRLRYEIIDAESGSYRRDSRNPDLRGHPKFKLASSLIILSTEKVDETRTTLKIVSSPVEETDNIVFLVHDATSLGIKANIKLKNRDNSMLVESVTTQLEDNRVKLIQGVGGVLGALMGIAKAGDDGPPSTFSGSIDLRRYFKNAGPRDSELTLSDADLKDYKNEFDHKFTVRSLKLGAIPADATLRKSFPFAASQRTLVFSACRSATIEVTIIGTYSYRATFKVADPNFVQTAGLPQKGSVSMHSECGVSVTSEPVQTASPTELIQELLKQFKAISSN